MFKLPKTLDIYQIEDTRQELITFLEKRFENDAEKIALDAQNTEDIDAAGVQLLLSVFKTAEKENIPFTINNIQNIFKRLILLSGVKHVWEEEVNE